MAFEAFKLMVMRRRRDRQEYEIAELLREIEEIEKEIERKFALARSLDHKIARAEFDISARRVALVSGGAE